MITWKKKLWYVTWYLWWLNTQFVRDYYELEQNRSSAAKRMIANDEPGCLSVMWQIMSWWLIAKSHSASTKRGHCNADGWGTKGISQDFFTQSAGRKRWSCFWLSWCSPCRDKTRYSAAASGRGAIKRPHQWVRLKHEAKKKCWSETKLYIIWESRSLPFSTKASVVEKWCLIEWGYCSFYSLLSSTNFWRSQELLLSDVYWLFNYTDCNFFSGWISLLHLTHHFPHQ